MSTEHYQFFSQSLEETRSKVSDDLHINQLLLANVITVFEYYLQSILVSLIQADKKLLIRLAESRKFRNQTIPISKAIANDMQQYTVAMVKSLVFHNLSEVEPLFKEALGVPILISKDIIDLINVRHDLVHRSGYTKTGKRHEVAKSKVLEAVAIVKSLIRLIDEQIVRKYHSILGVQISSTALGDR